MGSSQDDSGPILVVAGVSKSYGPNTALKPVSFEVRAGEFLALVGPSGSGKSTMLKIIGGFEKPSSGRIFIDGHDMTDTEPAVRPTSMVFQRLALFPHMTVADNIGFALKLRKVAKAERDQRIAAMMSLMHLKVDYAGRFPQQLSGGEQQRVALARSMISSPRILLLDEPLSALDVKLRKNLQAELRALHRKLGVTFVHVTHDLEEAMILADRICVMRNGEIVQLGTPADIYDRPQTAFVASFIGETNLLPIDVVQVDRAGITVEGKCLTGSRHRIPPARAHGTISRGPSLLLVRPEHLRLQGDSRGSCEIPAIITEVFLKGSITQYRARSVHGDASLVFEMQGARQANLDIGTSVALGFEPQRAFVVQVDDR